MLQAVFVSHFSRKEWNGMLNAHRLAPCSETTSTELAHARIKHVKEKQVLGLLGRPLREVRIQFYFVAEWFSHARLACMRFSGRKSHLGSDTGNHRDFSVKSHLLFNQSMHIFLYLNHKVFLYISKLFLQGYKMALVTKWNKGLSLAAFA